MDADHTLDVKGANCPMPVVKTKQEIDNVGEGEVLEVLATDPGAESDLQAWANRTGNEFLEMETDGDVLHIFLKKTA